MWVQLGHVRKGARHGTCADCAGYFKRIKLYTFQALENGTCAHKKAFYICSMSVLRMKSKKGGQRFTLIGHERIAKPKRFSFVKCLILKIFREGIFQY